MATHTKANLSAERKLDKDSGLTADRLRSLFRYEPDTGHLIRLWPATRKCDERYVGAPIGHPSTLGYTLVSIDGRKYLAHRLAWLWMTGDWPQHGIDHINGTGTDNRWENLRSATVSQNAANRGVQANSRSGIKGVWFDRSRGLWTAMIAVRGRRYSLGRHPTKEAAAAAYSDACVAHFGEFARTG